MRNKFFTLWMTCFFLLGSGMTYYITEHLTKDVMDQEAVEALATVKESNKIEQAMELILTHYMEEITKDQLVEGAITGMLNELSDPYSVYMNKEETDQFMKTLDSSFEGIGAEVTIQNGKIVIVSPIKNSPAEKAGLKARDEIIAVNKEPVTGLSLLDVTMKIRGEKGSKVFITVKREGIEKELVLEVIRDEIPNITVHSEVKAFRGQNIGYLNITSFSDDTAKEFAKQLSKLEDKNIKGLILDVRDNPGGRLDVVQEIANHFVSGKKSIVQIQERNGDVRMYHSSSIERKPYEVVVLINEGSASASEILAASLQEAEGYSLVGKKTFGKGTVQQTVAMGDGSTIKLTVYKWLTPNGNWIHSKGIVPTVEVDQSKLYFLHPLQITDSLVKDMNTDQVRYAQEMLDCLGYYPGRLDGYFSEKTVAAVRAFQQASGLKVNGVIDSKTATRLQEEIMTLQNEERFDLQLQSAIRLLSK